MIDACTNTGHLVLEVLHKNHPAVQEIDAVSPIN